MHVAPRTLSDGIKGGTSGRTRGGTGDGTRSGTSGSPKMVSKTATAWLKCYF